MSAQSSVDEVINALNVLYQGGDLKAREQANAWLEQFQKTPQAWTTADTILGTATAGLEVKMFAAQTLRNKIINDFSELGETGALSLRDSVVVHLGNARSGPQPLITQLCLSLADLAVQLGAWADPFSDMAGSFLGDPASVSCLLEFLAVLPEEVVNERIILPNDFYQQRSADLLTNKATDLIQLLVQCLQQPDLKADAHTRVLICFTTWLKSGEITLMMVANTPLIELAFAALKADDSDVFDTAVDAICGIIYETHLDRDDEPAAVEAKNAAVEQQLVPQLSMVADQMRGDQMVRAGDEDRSRGYCRIFTEAGEAWVHRMVLSTPPYESLIGALVDCMRLESLDVIAMLFDFWTILADKVLEYTNSCDPGRRMMASVFDTIIDIIIGHLKYPATYDTTNERGGWTAKERDEFREFRHTIGDVLKDCVRVVGQTKALMHAYEQIASRITSAQVPWQDIEAPLFALRAMGAEVSPTENDVLPKIMDMFAQFPPHPKLRYAATLVIGRYTEWTYEHPQYVQFQLSYIADGFKIREVAAASAQSLKYLCQDCAKFMADHWAELLEFFNEVASSGTLDDNDIIEFSEALAHVANGIPDQNTAEALQSFCLPVGNQLAAMLQAPELSENERRQVSLLLDRLGVFLRYVHIDDNETAEAWTGKIIADSWQVLSVAFQRFGGDAYISESICKFVRVLVEFYPTVVRPVIGQIVDAVVQAFQQTASTAYLWLARRILNVHRTLAAEETESLQLATSMVSQISSAAMSFFQTTPFSEVPETTEDYFRLMERAVEALPGYILTMQSFPYVFQAAIAALEVNQFHAQMAVVHFWSQVLSPTRRHLRVMRENRSTTSMPASSSSPGHFPSPARTRRRSIRMDTYPVEQIVELCTKNGFELVFKLMQGLMQSFDREAISEATEIFASLAAIVSDGPTTLAGQFDSPPQATMMDWQQAVLAQVPDANLPPTDRQSLMGDLSNHIQGRQWARVKSLMSDFAAVFRRRNAGN